MTPLDLLDSITEATEVISQQPDEKLDDVRATLGVIEEQLWDLAERLGIERPAQKES